MFNVKSLFAITQNVEFYESAEEDFASETVQNTVCEK